MINLNLKKMVAGVGLICAAAGAELNTNFTIRTEVGSDKIFTTGNDGKLTEVTNKSKLSLQRARFDFEKVMGDFCVMLRLGDNLEELNKGPAVASGSFAINDFAKVTFGRFVPVANSNYLSSISANAYNTAFAQAMGTRYSVDGYNAVNYAPTGNTATRVGVKLCGNDIMVSDSAKISYELATWESYKAADINFSKKMAAAARVGGVFGNDMGAAGVTASVAQVPENQVVVATYDKTRYYNLGANISAQGVFAEAEYARKTYKDAAEANATDKTNSAWRALVGFSFMGAKREAGTFAINEPMMSMDKASVTSMDCHCAEVFAHYSQNTVKLYGDVVLVNVSEFEKADTTYGLGANYFVGPFSIRADYAVAKYENNFKDITVPNAPVANTEKKDGHFMTLRLDMSV